MSERATRNARCGGVCVSCRARATEPRAAYLGQAMPLTSEILANAAPVEPTEIYRIAAACAGDCCQHFGEGRCSLVTRIVQLVPPVVTRAPACRVASELYVVATARRSCMLEVSTDCHPHARAECPVGGGCNPASSMQPVREDYAAAREPRRHLSSRRVVLLCLAKIWELSNPVIRGRATRK